MPKWDVAGVIELLLSMMLLRCNITERQVFLSMCSGIPLFVLMGTIHLCHSTRLRLLLLAHAGNALVCDHHRRSGGKIRGCHRLHPRRWDVRKMQRVLFVNSASRTVLRCADTVTEKEIYVISSQFPRVYCNTLRDIRRVGSSALIFHRMQGF